MQLPRKVFIEILRAKNIFEMAQESPVVSQYYSLVDSPQQYYIILQNFDMLESIFYLYQTKMIDMELWHKFGSNC